MCTNDGGVTGRVAGLAAAVAAVAEVDPAQLPASGQLDLLRQVWPLLCQLDAQVTRIVGAVNTQGAAAQEGATSTAAWLRSRLHAGGAGRRVQVAKALDALPEVAAAFERGEISFSHAHIAAKAAKDVDPQLLAAGVDKLLAEQAAEQPPGKFAEAAVQVRDHYNPDAADRHGRHLQTQWLDVDRTFGGAVSISGVLAPDTGELFLQTWARSCRRPTPTTSPRPPAAAAWRWPTCAAPPPRRRRRPAETGPRSPSTSTPCAARPSTWSTGTGHGPAPASAPAHR